MPLLGLLVALSRAVLDEKADLRLAHLVDGMGESLRNATGKARGGGAGQAAPAGALTPRTRRTGLSFRGPVGTDLSVMCM